VGLGFTIFSLVTREEEEEEVTYYYYSGAPLWKAKPKE
jgi:hypothetical protein